VLQAFLDKYQEEEEKEVERIKQRYLTLISSCNNEHQMGCGSKD